MQLESNTIALIGLVVTLILAIFSAFKYFSSEIAAVRREAATQIEAAKLQIENSKDAMVLKAENVAAQEGKQRHDLAGLMQTALTSLRVDLDRFNDRVTALALDTVRKSDMGAIENRLTKAIGDSEVRFTAALQQLEVNRKEQFAHIEGLLKEAIAKFGAGSAD